MSLTDTKDRNLRNNHGQIALSIPHTWCEKLHLSPGQSIRLSLCLGGTPKSPSDSILIQLNPTPTTDIAEIESICRVIPKTRCTQSEEHAIKWIRQYFYTYQSGEHCTLWASWRKYLSDNHASHLPRSKFWALVKRHSGHTFPHKQLLDRKKQSQKK